MCLTAWLRNPCRYPAFVGLVLYHYSIESSWEQENKKHVEKALPAAENGLAGEKSRTLRSPSSLPPRKRHPASGRASLFGGVGGSRTPVRRQLGKNFSGCSLLFTFPHPGGSKHPTGISSFMMHGMGKAYHTHGLHSNHTLARLVDLPGRMGA